MTTSPGSLLREARETARLTQAELAERLGVSQPSVARLEREDANPTIATLERALLATGHLLQPILASWGDGADERLLRAQLELTPAQRIEDLETMYAFARELAPAGERARGELA
jgi:transcriptional regulator with XRE-family HTH domain